MIQHTSEVILKNELTSFQSVEIKGMTRKIVSCPQEEIGQMKTKYKRADKIASSKK